MRSVWGVCRFFSLMSLAALAAADANVLHIKSITPSGEVRSARQIVIEFDRPVVGLGEFVSAAQLARIEIRPALQCEWRWLDPQRLACELYGDKAPASATEYTVKVLQGFTATGGARTAEAFEGRFVTPRPEISFLKLARFEKPGMPVFELFSRGYQLVQKSLQQRLHFRDASGRRYPVSLRRAEHDSDSGFGWTVVPAAELPQGADFSLVLDAGLKSHDGPLASDREKILHTFRTYSEFRLAGVECAFRLNDKGRPEYETYHPQSSPPCLYNHVRLKFTAPVNPRRVRAALDAPLKTSGDDRASSWMEETVNLNGLLAPGEHNRLHLALGAGIKDQFGRRLQEAFETTVRTTGLEEIVWLPESAVLEQGEATDLPVLLANVKSATIEGRLYNPGTGRSRKLSATEFWRSEVDNRIHIADAGIRKLFGRESGYFKGAVSTAGKSTPLSVQVTPFNIASFATHSGYWIWVVRFDKAEPVADAAVRVYSSGDGLPREQARAKTFRTDSSGMVFVHNRDIEVPRFTNYQDAPRLIMEVMKDGAAGYLAVTANEWFGYQSGARTLNALRGYGDSRFVAWTLFSQPLYKPGDSVKFKIYGREVTREGYKAPARKKGWLSVWYEGDEQEGYLPGYHQRKIVWSDFGAWSGEFELPPNAPHGEYSLSVGFMESAEASYAGHFSVAEFNKQGFELSLNTDQTALREGEPITVTATAALHNGGPYSRAPAMLRATVLSESGFFEDVFKDDRREDFPAGFYFQPAVEGAAEQQRLFEVRGSTDARGVYSHAFKPKLSEIYYGLAEIEASVEDARGKAISASHSRPYFTVDRLVGVKFAASEVAAGATIEAQAITIEAADREPVSDVPVTLRIERDTLRQDYHYRHEKFDWKPLKNCQLRSSKSVVACPFQPASDGYYRITAEIRDTHGQVHSSSMIEWIDVTKPRQQAVLPSFKLHAPDQVKAGDVLEYTIDSEADAATALVTVERNEFLQSTIHRLRRGSNTFSLPVTSAMAPGFYLRISVQRPRSASPAAREPEDIDAGAPFMLHQHRLIHVVDQRSELELSVQPDRKIYAPGDQVTLTLDARSAEPGAAVELSVAVVDQALLQLDGPDVAEKYDPRTGFLFPYRSDFDFILSQCSDLTLAVAGYEYRGAFSFYSAANRILIPEGYQSCINNLMDLQRVANVDEEIVVSGIRSSLAAPLRVRSAFRDVAFWLAGKTVIAGKPETVEFRLPDNLTRWRIFVTAAGKDSQFGMISADIVTEKMTELRAALPSHLVEGDELSARFSIFNRSAETRRLQYGSRVGGALSARPGTRLEGALEMEPSGRSMVDLEVKAHTSGVATLHFNAGDAGDKDALETALPVAPRAAPHSVFLRGEISPLNGSQAPFAIPVQLPSEALSGSARLTMNFSVSQLDDIRGALEYGRDYPYTCWEQTLSRAVLAALYLRAPQYLRDQLRWENPGRLITETLDEAAGFQNYDGGMTFFGPGNGEPNRYLSAYTLVAFSWLKGWGYKVPAEIETSLQEYLVEAIAHEPRLQGDTIVPALPLLLQRGLIEPDQAVRLLPEPGQSSTLDTVYRLALSPLLKPRMEYDSLLEALDREAYQDRDGNSFPLASTAVAQCSLLSLLAGNPGFFKGQHDRIERLVASTRRLLRGSGHWRNTQENVYCARALLDHDRYFNALPADIDIRATAGGVSKNLALKGGNAGSRKPKVLEFDPGAPGSTTEISLEAGGRGRAWYTARLDYARDMDKVAAESQGFAIRRSYKIRRGDDWVEPGPGEVLQRGQIVRIDLGVWAPAQRSMVAVVDRLPGNLEAINPAFATSRISRDEDEHLDDGYNHADYVFFHRELGLQSVRFYGEHVPSGEYRLQYMAQVIAAGRFTAPPPLVEEMYAPEIYGRGAATVLISRQVDEPM